MEREIAGDVTSRIMAKELDLDELSSLEKRLNAPRWRERAEAARVAASIVVDDGHLRHLSLKNGLSAQQRQVVDVYDKLLRQLLHRLAFKDSQWQVRLSAVESGATILGATKSVLPVEMFAEYVWVVLAVCQDVQPEVQLAASNCISRQLLFSSFNESHVIVSQLCDRFVEAATASDTFSLKAAKLSTKLEVTGLDNLPDGEVLLSGMIAAIYLQLLPLPTSDRLKRQNKELDKIPLLVVVVAVALEDANKRQSRTISRGFSQLLRCLGKSPYRQSLVDMFNFKAYLSGSDLVRIYQHAGIINDDTANLLKTVKTVTILSGLSLAFEDTYADECLTNGITSDNLSSSQSYAGLQLPQEELVALQQILEMLRVPEDLTKPMQEQEKEYTAFEFTESAMPLLSISISFLKNRNLVSKDQPLPKKMVEDLLLCCGTFGSGGGEYVDVTWTSKELGKLALTLLTFLSDSIHPMGTSEVSKDAGLKDSTASKVLMLISGQLPSLLPRVKQVIQDSSGSIGSDVLYKPSPDGSVALSIIAAHQMQWILTQLEHPHLDPHCQLVMPCVLTALDHFSPEVKRQAMRTCIHLAQNMNPTELRWYKDVILDAVARSLIGCGDLWPVAVKLAVTTVTRIEGRNPRGSWCGRIFSEMIGELERHRDDKSRRILWLQEISPYLQAMGLVLVAHFKRLLPLLYYWLHAPDDDTCLLTLTGLQIVITYTWPRIPAHVKRIWKELIHTYQESINKKSTSDIQAAVFEVCRLLHLCASPTFEAVWQQDKEDKSIAELVAFLNRVNAETVVEM